MAFIAGPPPQIAGASQEVQQLVDILWTKLQDLEDELSFLGLDERNFAPLGVEGMVVFADGTNWNPGSGRGLYRFSGGSWEKI